MITNIPTSLGGLNISDPLDNMDPAYCIQMDNVIAEENGDKVRSGFIKVHEAGCNTLIPHAVYGEEAFIACMDDGITTYDVDFNVVGAEKTGFANDDWVHAPFTDGAGAVHTFLANGVNIPQEYTHTAGLQDSSFTIPDGVMLDSPLSYKNRLYFIGGAWDIYYGGVQSISGALTKFSMGSFFKKGGKILSITNWTQDAGSGVDDLFVIISTEGEVMIYQGSNPDADDWKSLGVFTIPRPITKRCCEMVGADVAVITESGYYPLSRVLSDQRANRTAISSKLNGITNGRDYTKRWDIKYFTKNGWLIVNAPSKIERYAYEQHVLNTNTNAWCRFVGMDSVGWCILFDRIFFCNGNGIFEANRGTTDDGNYITYQIQKAYNTFGTPLKKQLMRVIPRFYSLKNEYFYKRINIDFKEGNRSVLPEITGFGYSSYWDEAIWDESYWSDEYTAFNLRGAVSSRAGSYLSIGFYGRTKNELTFFSTGLILKECNGHI